MSDQLGVVLSTKQQHSVQVLVDNVRYWYTAWEVEEA